MRLGLLTSTSQDEMGLTAVAFCHGRLPEPPRFTIYSEWFEASEFLSLGRYGAGVVSRLASSVSDSDGN